MLIMAMVVAGAAAYMQLGVDRFPQMDLPTLMVVTNYPGATPNEVETEVSQVLEDSIATVAGIDELRSISRDSTSLLLITFEINRDIDSGAQDVRDAVNSVLNRLPVGIDPPVIRKQDTDSSPIMTLAVSGPRDARELYFLADRFVKNVIESSKGVGEVTIIGASDRAIRIDVNANRLAAYNLSILDVRDAITKQNTEIPGGRLDTGLRELGLRTLGRFTEADEFENMTIKTVNGNPIRLRDIGRAIDGTKEVRTMARLDGQPAVMLQIQRQSGTNTIEVIDGIKEKLDRCQQLLPDDVHIQIIQDQSRYIKAAMHEVQGHLTSGSILASLVVLIFMRSWRSTVIAAVAIPASVIATFAAMRALDFTLNNVTMLALVLMIGVVIDDAIVVLENVFHWVEEKGVTPFEAAVGATKEVGLAVLATTVSLVIVFLPVSFLSSVTGKMLYQFGVTATVAILVSMLVSFSLTPMMCSRMLRAMDASANAPKSRQGFYYWLEVSYTAMLRWSLRHKWLVCAVSVLVIASNVPLYKFVKQDYIPTNVDESEFEVSITLPEGVTLQTLDETMRVVEEEIRQCRGVEHVLTTVGTRSMGAVNSANVYVSVSDIASRTFSLERLFMKTLQGDPMAAIRDNFTQRDVMTQVRSRLSKYPDLEVSVRNLTSLRQGAPVDIDFAISGPDLDDLIVYSQKLKEKVEKLPGIVDTYVTLKVEKPELLAHIDRKRAASLGIQIADIAETLRVAIGGDDRVSRFRDPKLDDAYDVELRLVGVDRDSPEDVGQLYVRCNPTEDQQTRGMGIVTTDGGAVLTRVSNIVDFEETYSAARIDRLDRQRMVAVRSNITGDFALADRIEAFHKAAEELNMPPAFSTSVRGRGRELERTLSDFGLTFILSFIFMYIVLAAQFEHLVHPITILISLPLAVPFGLVSLWLGGESLNLYSALGILVLFGVVKKASILQVDHTNQLRERGLDRDTAIIQANRDRLRPILMTTISFVAGMFPLLVGTGPGAEERRSVAVLAVGGQTLSLLLTLLAVPVFYVILDDMGLLAKAGLNRLRSAKKPETTPVPEPETVAVD